MKMNENRSYTSIVDVFERIFEFAEYRDDGAEIIHFKKNYKKNTKKNIFFSISKTFFFNELSRNQCETQRTEGIREDRGEATERAADCSRESEGNEKRANKKRKA